MKLNNWTKALLTGVCFVIAITGFMIKLPPVFQHYDKEMHALFYFCAAAFLNILFAGTKITRHIAIFIFLVLFGMAIEYAQEYSNKLLHKRIHGRYDVEDVQSNLKGLIAFSMVWIVYVALWSLYQKSKHKKVVNNAD